MNSILNLYNKTFFKTAIAAVLIVGFGLMGAKATPIDIPNASFELPNPPQITASDVNIASGWVFNFGSAFGTNTISDSNFPDPGTASGNAYAVIFNGQPGMTDTITSAASLGTISAQTEYTLTVAIGNPSGNDSFQLGSPGNTSFSLLANDVPFATETVPNGTVSDGTFEDFTLTYTTPEAGSIIGENLKIQLTSLPIVGGIPVQASFDNVRLDAASTMAVPEPHMWLLLIMGTVMLAWLIQRSRSRGALALILILSVLNVTCVRADAIKTLPLDDRTVYHLKVGTDKVTTLVFPQPITALEGSGITADSKTPAKMLLSYHGGDRFFSVRALSNPATADLNVIINRKVYVLELVADSEPFQSVTFYPADEPPAQSPGQPNVEPSRLLGLLDQAKAYPLLAEQYPEMVSQIDRNEPFTQTLYEGFHVILTKVFRFDAEDALIFQVEFVNETDQPIFYVPQSLAVRVGSGVYWSALSDASGIMTPGEKDLKSGKVIAGHSNGYFVICGAPHGGRNHLSVQNKFNVLVFRQEKTS